MRSGKSEKARILLVDDDGPIRSSLRIFFEAEGYEFLGVGSAERGLEEVGRQHYDVIIADYRLPGMDGLEVLKIFKKMVPEMPVIMLTGHGSEQAAQEGIASGAADYLTKPYDLEELIEKIREVCTPETD